MADDGRCALHDEVMDRWKERNQQQEKWFGEIFKRLRSIEWKIAIGLGVIGAIELFARLIPWIERIKK